MPAYSNYAHCPRRLHRRARLGPAVRRLPRQEHLRPARHDAVLVPAAAAGGAHGRHGAGLQGRDSDKPQGYELINLAPAGSLAATGADMARFMIAHLQNGAFGDARILAEETAKKMHGTPLTIIPNVNRMVLGFYETDTNGHRIISHGGDTQYFHSDLHLFVDDGVGYFISFNSAGKEGAVGPAARGVLPQLRRPLLPGPRAGGQGRRGDGEGARGRDRGQLHQLAPRRVELPQRPQPAAAREGRRQRGRHDLAAAAAATSTASRPSGARSRPTSGARLTARRGSRPR